MSALLIRLKSPGEALYKCGSTPAPIRALTLTCFPPTLRARSATIPVVQTIWMGCWPANLYEAPEVFELFPSDVLSGGEQPASGSSRIAANEKRISFETRNMERDTCGARKIFGNRN